MQGMTQDDVGAPSARTGDFDGRAAAVPDERRQPVEKERLKILEKAIARLEPGEFHFPEIYGPGWSELYIGDKVKLGRDFMNLVRKGRFADVSDTETKKAGGRVYLKRA